MLVVDVAVAMVFLFNTFLAIFAFLIVDVGIAAASVSG